MTDRDNKILILDCGSRHTQLIARRIRELGVFSEILPWNSSLERIKDSRPSGLIISGGSEGADDALPLHPMEIFNLTVPVLGICYGMQLIAHSFGVKISRSVTSGYGEAGISVSSRSRILGRLKQDKKIKVLMGCGGQVNKLPSGFIAAARSEDGALAAFESSDGRISALGFHPEFVKTECGNDVLSAFVFDICGCLVDWDLGSGWIDKEIEKIREKVGEGRVICGLSGGVDSSVAAVITSKAVGDRLHCIFVDHGLLRKNEADQVMETYRSLNLNVRKVDAEERFMKALAGVTEPERKRKIIGELFVRVFEEEARAVGGSEWLLQGTIYPDIVESGHDGGNVIKSHHNVGGLPEDMEMGLLEPLRDLFKDEVRKVGRSLGMESHFLERHPFPGPGLAVRCLGELKKERLDALREADAIFIEEIENFSLYNHIWQAFAALLPVRSVGVTENVRTYGETAVLRAVSSLDAMTADWVHLPYELLDIVGRRICNEVPAISRVVYDVTGKPPATIEWE